MIGEIKAIETRYAGHRFRSRLEARWAVFFDALELRWEYEPEAFALPSGNYLPDFRLHLPSGAVWFEVKPREAYRFDSRWEELAILTSTMVYIAFGMPRLTGSDADFWEHIEARFDSGGHDIGYQFCACRCGRVGIEFDGRSARICDERCYPGEDKVYTGHAPRMLAAYQKALSARFEPRAQDASAIAVTAPEMLSVSAGACIADVQTVEQRRALVHAWATLVRHHPSSTPTERALVGALLESLSPVSSEVVEP